ncbi:ArsR/SmtB family transcription factor [Candidatus Harpocratesius sp.]
MKINPHTISSFFSVLGDETRIKILLLLFVRERSVKDIQMNIGEITLPGITYQLNILKENHLVKFQKDGQHRYYSLADTHVLHILADAIQHIRGGDGCDKTLSCLEEHLHILQGIEIKNE